MAATTTITAEQFLAQPRHEDERVELVRGEVVAMGTAQFIHERVKAKLNRAITAFLIDRSLGEVFVETMFRFGNEDVRIPDLSLLLNEQIPQPAPAAVPAIAPALTVEVVSSESAADLEDKVELYVDSGCKEVWIVYPEQRAIRTYHPDGGSRLHRQTDTLTCDWLPGLAIPVASIFEGL
jgi:Uma2 family endonuclease